MGKGRGRRRGVSEMRSRGGTGGGRWGRAPPPAFHTLPKDMYKNRGETHFSLGLCTYYLILLITNIPAPPLKITQLRPC